MASNFPRRLPDSTEGTILVTLDPVEATTAEVLSALRHSNHTNRGNGQQLGGAFSGRDEDIQGMLGEYAVGKAINRWVPFVVADPWASVKFDVGRLYQVRSTTHRKGSLLVQEKDPDDQVYILARLWESSSAGVQVRVGGWMWGMEAKREEWWNPPHFRLRSPAFMVPAHELHPIGELPDDS